MSQDNEKELAQVDDLRRLLLAYYDFYGDVRKMTIRMLDELEGEISPDRADSDASRDASKMKLAIAKELVGLLDQGLKRIKGAGNGDNHGA